MLSHGQVPFLATFDGTRDRVHYGAALNGGMSWFINDRLRRGDRRWGAAADDLAAALREQVVCLTVIAEEPALAELQSALLADHAGEVETHLFENQYCPGWHWLTVHDRRATKDRAIKTLLADHGLSGQEVVAFGDQANDLKMLRFADRAVAVANATDAVKRHAHAVIGPNEEDSVVRFIQNDWDGKGRE